MTLSDLRKPRIPEEELVSSGHIACAGCGERLALKFALKALGRNTVIVVPASCSAVVDGMFPTSAVSIPYIHNTFESTAAVAAGVKRGFQIQNKHDITVLAWAGDGGTYDIGLQALSAAAERNEDIVYICYDNEAYMNTGIQRSSSTPFKTWTTTTPLSKPKIQPKKNIMDIMASHRIPYAATASIAFPEDMINKIKKAKETKGLTFILTFTPCPTGWKSAPEDTVKLARLAVTTRIFPLYEIYNGVDYKVNKEIRINEVEEYFNIQGRFKDITEEDLKYIKENIQYDWDLLLKKEM
ncbi:thiamine pyrophosphate-dependent enzyme [candidate division KSB1 bacterium]